MHTWTVMFAFDYSLVQLLGLSALRQTLRHRGREVIHPSSIRYLYVNNNEFNILKQQFKKGSKRARTNRKKEGGGVIGEKRASTRAKEEEKGGGGEGEDTQLPSLLSFVLAHSLCSKRAHATYVLHKCVQGGRMVIGEKRERARARDKHGCGLHVDSQIEHVVRVTSQNAKYLFLSILPVNPSFLYSWFIKLLSIQQYFVLPFRYAEKN
jgi:hypothetical protein